MTQEQINELIHILDTLGDVKTSQLYFTARLGVLSNALTYAKIDYQTGKCFPSGLNCIMFDYLGKHWLLKCADSIDQQLIAYNDTGVNNEDFTQLINSLYSDNGKN